MQKKELRKKYKELRKTIDSEKLEDLSLAIANNCLQLPIWDFENYHLFLSITEHQEVDTEFLLQILSGKDKNVILSRSDFETRKMNHVLLTDNLKIVKNEWNIPEPVNGIPISDKMIDVVFIPLLAYDKNGNRVGYGKGFYDLFLSKCKKDVIKVGLSLFEPEEKIEDVFENDIALNYCVTPNKIYEFNSKIEQ